MKNALTFLLYVIILITLIAGAYFWANGIMDSIYAFRSPLQNNPPQPGKALLPEGVEPATRRLVFVLVDALRVDTALDPNIMPTLAKLRQQGASAIMHSRAPSYSEPGYSVLLIGAWPELSDGPAMNLDYADIPVWTQDNLFSASARAGLKTAVSAFNWFEKLIPQADVSASFYTAGEDQAADRQVVDAALPWLREGGYQFVLIHIDQVDYAGHHEGGARDPRWNQAAQRADALLAEILAELDLSQDTLLVLSDHGQIDAGGHGGNEAIVLKEPFVLAGAGVKPGDYGDLDMVDVAPTMAALLGANIPASNQGRVRSEMLLLPTEVTANLEAAVQAQQSQLLEAYQAAIGRSAEVKPGPDVVAAYQQALEDARNKRLNAERLPRMLLAVLLGILALGWFIWKRRSELVWFLGAGLLYLAIFHLRYGLLDGRTYSLSSVASANDLIMYCVTTAALALFLSWLVLALWRRLFRLSPGEAARWTFELAFMVVFMLAIPILWSFALNGASATWTLPHFTSMFLGFLSLIQILAVSAVSLILAGVTGIIARAAPPAKPAQSA